MDAGKILYKLTYAEDLPTEGRAAPEPKMRTEYRNRVLFLLDKRRERRFVME
jgi:hypothetical protein